jgi:hypothetical protein
MSIIWPIDATYTLIRQRRAEQPNFEWVANYEHNRIWSRISFQILLRDGFYVSTRQCQIKWQALKNGYENIGHILNSNPDEYNIRSPNRYDRLFHAEMSDEFWISSSDYLIHLLLFKF